MFSRANFRRSIFVATMGAALVLGQSTAFAAPLVDQTIAGPIGGAEVCAAGQCAEAEGISNVRIVVEQTGPTVTRPAIFTGSAPGCTANINVALFATSPGVGGASVTPTVTFDRTDKNGNVVGSGSVGGTAVLVPSVPGMTVPVASVCATLL